jgi:putative restriction endonuclease
VEDTSGLQRGTPTTAIIRFVSSCARFHRETLSSPSSLSASARGIVASNCYECPKPAEFGDVARTGTRSDGRFWVNFVRMENQIRPRKHIGVLGPLLPDKYSPLQASGRGNQIYLAEISSQLAEMLVGLIGRLAQELALATARHPELRRPAVETADIEVWEHHLKQTIENTTDIPDTERQSLIVARRGQGLFKERVMRIETFCRVTKV